METMERTFRFTNRFGCTKGPAVELVSIYYVQLRRYEDSEYTYITIQPDVGPCHRHKTKDVGITWHSLFVAWRWCNRDNGANQDVWTEISMSDAEKSRYAPECTDLPCNTRTKVIHRQDANGPV